MRETSRVETDCQEPEQSPAERRRTWMLRRLVFLNKAEGPTFARPRVSKPDLSFRSQNCGGRAWIPGPVQPCLARSCAPDFCVCPTAWRALRNAVIIHRGQEAGLPRHACRAQKPRAATVDCGAHPAGRSLGSSMER